MTGVQFLRLVFTICLLWLGLLAGGRGPSPSFAQEAEPADVEPAVTNRVETVEADEKPDDTSREAAYDYLELLAEVILHVRKSYAQERNYKELVYGALHGMLESLDPHSAFLEPDEYSEMKEDTAGKFGGIGIHVGMRNGFLTVIAPIEGTPAFKAGLVSGDRIIGIEGEKTTGITLRQAVKKLRGEKGTAVALQISREGADKPLDVEIVRAEINVPSVKGTRMLNKSVGYTRITQFAYPTVKSFREAIDQLQKEEMKALILDLRSNPGGLLTSAIGVAEQLLPKGELIVTTRGREGAYPAVQSYSRGSDRLANMPIAVLVNRGSASASEIVAGALKAHRRAVLVGQQTFGKASVQSVVRLKAGAGESAIRLTTAHYFTPDGKEIHGEGIEPDIEVILTPTEWAKVQVRRARTEEPELYSEEEQKLYEDAVDFQLQRAMDVLQGVLVFEK